MPSSSARALSASAKMPIPFLFELAKNGPPVWVRNNALAIIYGTITTTVLALLKMYTSGRKNTADQNLHGKVVILTGGTSGVGMEVANDLAARGAQLVLLTRRPPSDPFLADFVDELRDKHGNHLIYAEQVDLSSLHSIRKFATKWVDNAPPRRLDMIVLCAATLTSPGGERKETDEGIEETWMVNFLANFQLLGILSPALRAQSFDRDVRVIMASCSSYIGSPSLSEPLNEESWTPAKAYARSKLALNVFGKSFQKHLDAYKRPDGMPMNTSVIFADPGLCRTPGTRQWLSRGSILGLGLYMIGYAVPWLFLKSGTQGAQSILYAAMEPSLGRRGQGGKLVKECQIVDFARTEVGDDKVAKKLWEESDALILRTEKAEAKKRAQRKAEKKKASAEKATEKTPEPEVQDDRAAELENLMDALSKPSDREKEKEKRGDKDRKKDKDRKRDKEKEKEREKEKDKKKDKERKKEKERERERERDRERTPSSRSKKDSDSVSIDSRKDSDTASIRSSTKKDSDSASIRSKKSSSKKESESSSSKSKKKEKEYDTSSMRSRKSEA